MDASPSPSCISQGALLQTGSYATLSKGSLNLELKISTINTKNVIRIVCIPKIKQLKISTLHGKLYLIDVDNLVLPDYIIGRKKLENKEITDSNLRAIDVDELENQNVFIKKEIITW